ncbi:hypothetical protein [Sulfurimonas autotrophica]|uniref:Uncharacterized protein n=1 Tax=Sulfurimonas autotrophica (strain ATCC BAA-671 / DSM 16294 / JCM 11897 / OK10) TaxID=563040 RepID=E0USP7_SULAO|nr:hypothetical protein [Sulfurimonas autotrophica]ADN09210.1 conserved hypothetical protein [Sulfurimonas autotrophica DSM 16294]
MKRYIYNADIGTFEIQQTSHLLYQLWIGEELLGEYESAELAAADVSGFNTDYVEWDKLENELENIPANLSEWSAIAEETSPK